MFVLRYATVCRLSIRPSIRLSVTFRYRDHIGWNTSKIISQLISLRSPYVDPQHMAIWSNGNTPGIGFGSWLMRTKICNIFETV